METQTTPNSQSNLEKEEWSWGNQPSCLQTMLQSYINQEESMVDKKTEIWMNEKDRKPRDKPMHLWMHYL